MQIKGSCHCQRVTFSATSKTPYPFIYCYCSICRKTAGGSGCAINIMAEATSLRVKGEEYLSIYENYAMTKGDDPSQNGVATAKRYFCKHCGSALWLHDQRWPEAIYPLASIIDTPLPKPDERFHIMLDFVASWCEVPQGEHEKCFSRYPEEGIADWHKRKMHYDGPSDG